MLSNFVLIVELYAYDGISLLSMKSLLCLEEYCCVLFDKTALTLERKNCLNPFSIS
jgi:hypothetical protein